MVTLVGLTRVTFYRTESANATSPTLSNAICPQLKRITAKLSPWVANWCPCLARAILHLFHNDECLPGGSNTLYNQWHGRRGSGKAARLGRSCACYDLMDCLAAAIRSLGLPAPLITNALMGHTDRTVGLRGAPWWRWIDRIALHPVRLYCREKYVCKDNRSVTANGRSVIPFTWANKREV